MLRQKIKISLPECSYRNDRAAKQQPIGEVTDRSEMLLVYIELSETMRYHIEPMH